MSSLTARAGKTPGRTPGEEAGGGSSVTGEAKPCSWSRDGALAPGLRRAARRTSRERRSKRQAAHRDEQEVGKTCAAGQPGDKKEKREIRDQSVADPPSPIPNLV